MLKPTDDLSVKVCVRRLTLLVCSGAQAERLSRVSSCCCLSIHKVF